MLDFNSSFKVSSSSLFIITDDDDDACIDDSATDNDDDDDEDVDTGTFDSYKCFMSLICLLFVGVNPLSDFTRCNGFAAASNIYEESFRRS